MARTEQQREDPNDNQGQPEAWNPHAGGWNPLHNGPETGTPWGCVL